MTAPPLFYRPAVFFHHLPFIALSFPQWNIQRVSKMFIFQFYYFLEKKSRKRLKFGKMKFLKLRSVCTYAGYGVNICKARHNARSDLLDVPDPWRFTAEHSDSAYTMNHAQAHLPPTLTFPEHSFSTTFSFRISRWIIWRCIILLPPLHSLLLFFLDTFFLPVSSLIVLAPPTLPGRSASIGSLAEHCPFLLFLCLRMRRRKRRRRRTRNFKTPVNFNLTAKSSVPENWTFVVTILRTLNPEWVYIHTFELCLWIRTTGTTLRAHSHAQPFEPLFPSVTQSTSGKTKTLESFATASRKTADRLGAAYSQHRFGLKPGWPFLTPYRRNADSFI